MNSYFQSDSFEADPIVKFFKPYFLTSSTENMASYYFMPLSFNNALLNDGMLMSGERNLTFVGTRIDYTYLQ